jgi:hypothetical protein
MTLTSLSDLVAFTDADGYTLDIYALTYVLNYNEVSYESAVEFVETSLGSTVEDVATAYGIDTYTLESLFWYSTDAES